MSKTETQSDALTAERRLFITAVANLELRKKFGDEGFRLDLERDELEALIEVAERVSRLDAENKALRARLEIDPSHPIDGIAARDETIRQLDVQIKELRIKAARYDYIRTGAHYTVKIGRDSIHCGGHSMSEKYGPALDDAIDAAMASMRRQKAAEMFDRAAQTLEEATASASAMASAMEQEGRLMKAPRAAAKTGDAA